MTFRVTLAVAIGAALFVGVRAPSSLAQYVPVAGSITSIASSTTAGAGQVIDISCTLRDRSGASLPGRTVAFVLNSSPGEARLDRSAAVTDAFGVAMARLDVGSRTGVVQVSCSSDGLSSMVTVQVLGAIAAGGLPSIAPVSAAAPVIAPRTGDAGLEADFNPVRFAVALAAVSAAAVLVLSLALAFGRAGPPDR